jgi:predicted nucleotidyltransferase
MKVVGLITEYNPFHNGHKYHIEMARKITDADYVIAVMSGDFVQRGAPAVISKYDRGLMAIKNGVDLVFELPICYATGSAQYFALGAVALLNGLGIVDYLCFGSECGDIKALEDAAELIYNPNDSLQELLYSYIREGYSYPAARARATAAKGSDMADVISEPNNILGIEYINALKRLSSPIKPITIKRELAHYHDKNLGASISSATAIRNILQDNEAPMKLSLINDSVPQDVYDYFINNYHKKYPITIEDFSSVVKYKIMSESSNELAEYMDLSSDLADRIKNVDALQYSMDELLQKIKSKNITLTRANRALIHILLNIKRKAFNEYINDNIIYYARILAMRKEASPLIRRIKKHGRLPVITKIGGVHKLLDTRGMQMLNQNIFATHLYNQVIYDKYRTILPNEYRHGICIL